MIDRTARLKDLLKANPEDSFLQHALALEYIKAGDEAGARQLFESILLKDPAYIGSYYHLGKLLERTGETALAIEWYEKGMLAAKTGNDNHAHGELKAAYEDLIY